MTNKSISNNPIINILSIISVCLAIPAALLALPPVQDVLFDKRPRISISLISEFTLLDINSRMDGLEVFLKGAPLDSTKESLTALRVRIQNDGRSSVSASDVSISDPIGFTVAGGEIIEVAKLSASSQHLLNLASPLNAHNKITISNRVIIDEDDYIEFNILVKKPIESKISINPLGKIANSPAPVARNYVENPKKENKFSVAFKGDYAVHSIRVPAYTLVGFFILLAAALMVDWAQKAKMHLLEYSRKAKAQQYITAFPSIPPHVRNFCAALYIARGSSGIAKELEYITQKPLIETDDLQLQNIVTNSRYGITDKSSDFSKDHSIKDFKRALRENGILSFFNPLQQARNELELVNEAKNLVYKPYVDSLTFLKSNI